MAIEQLLPYLCSLNLQKMKKNYSSLIIRFLKTFSLLGVMVALLFAYYALPERLAIHFNEFDNPDGFLAKEKFFYVAGITAVVFNITLSLLANMIASIHPRFLHVPHRDFWLENKENRNHFYEIYQHWFSSLAILINLFLITCTAVLIYSHTTKNLTVFHFSWLPLLGGVLLVAWVVYLPLRLQFRKQELLF